MEAFKQQHLEPNKVVAPVEEEDVPPPPSPPKSKAIVLPPNWKTARDAEGKMYYYHTVTRLVSVFMCQSSSQHKV